MYSFSIENTMVKKLPKVMKRTREKMKGKQLNDSPIITIFFA
jgi:hypothetical protein